ncbi:MAG: hypothetical protein ACFE0R_11720 [Salinarimonas sp.]
MIDEHENRKTKPDEPGTGAGAEESREKAGRKPADGARGPIPPAGPHDSPELTNPDATPGTGVLPGHDRKGRDTDPGGG